MRGTIPLVLSAGLLASCGDGRTEITPDVVVVQLSGATNAIVDSEDNFLIYPNVVEYKVVDSWLVGKRERANDNSDDSAAFISGLGYFKLSLADGSLVQGMTEVECAKDSVCSELL